MAKIIIYIILASGTILSSFLSGIRKKLPIKLLNIPLSTALSLFIFASGLYVYAKLNHLSFLQTDFFNDRISLLVGGYIYLIVSTVSGIIIGAIESKSLSRYIKAISFSNCFKPLTAMFLISSIAFAACGVYLTYNSEHFELKITEVCAHNFNLVADAEGNYSDYIELYNDSDSSIKLSYFYLTDNDEVRSKFRLPEIELGPHEYIIVWADGSKNELKNNEIHANFKLSDDETIILTSFKGIEYARVNTGALRYNVSATLLDNKFISAYGTPGKTNENCQLYTPATLETPLLSLESGFYPEDSITLEIAANPKYTVYYTTDGSTPTVNSTKYTSPITIEDISASENKYVSIKNTVKNYDDAKIDTTPVDKATVIRAIAVDAKGNISDVTSGTYFVGEIAKKYEGYAILSVITDPDNLFGDNGICVTGKDYDQWYNNTDRTEPEPQTNFAKHGKEWEREVVLQFWDADGNYEINQNCGIRVQGNASRGYAIKRFSFYARDNYDGSDFFENELFEGVQTHSIYLRHDKYDVIVHEVLDARENTSVQHGIPAVFFVDGEFYCETYIREKYDEEYFSGYYNVSADNLLVITDSEPECGGETAVSLHNEFISFVSNSDASDPEVYSQIAEQMDIQSFIDFICANLYLNNIDWGLHKNYLAWRSISTNGDGYNDGKWRWCIYDMDAVGWSQDKLSIPNAEIDPFTIHLPYVNADYKEFLLTYAEAPIYSSLIKNEEFKRQFVLTYLDLINSHFSVDYTQPILMDYSLENNAIWDDFFAERPEHAINNLVKHLSLSGKTSEISIDTNDPAGGKILINTITADNSNGVWSATYLTDYPITITALPADGWEFAGWEGSIESLNETLSVNLTENGIELKAIFVKTGGDN